MKTLKTIFTVAIVLVTINFNSYGAVNDEALKFSSLNAGLIRSGKSLKVNLVNTDNLKVKLVLKDENGKVVSTKKMSHKSFSTKNLKTSNLKPGFYTAEFITADKVLKKLVKI